MDLQHTQQYGYSLKDTEAEEVIRGEASVDEIAVGPRGSIDERQWDLTTPRQDGGHFPTSPKAATFNLPSAAELAASRSHHATTPLGSKDARKNLGPKATFGIAAIEEPDKDVRHRGSSASSSVAFLETRGGSVPQVNREGSFASGSGIGLGLVGRRSSLTDEIGVEPRLVDLLPNRERLAASAEGLEDARVGEAPGDIELSLQEKRLAAKVERKREAAMRRSKEGAFPPPEEGYQFPSPTIGSPRESTDESSPTWEAANAPVKPAAPLDALFHKLASSTSHERLRPSPFNPAYVPLSPPDATLPVFSREPISPCSKEPPVPHIATAEFSAQLAANPSAAEAGLVADVPGSPDSVFSESTEMQRDFSDFDLAATLYDRAPAQHSSIDHPPSNRILRKIDSALGPKTSTSASTASPLDTPRRRLLLHTPVLQVVNAHTVKDRHLFLFDDVLLITKPIIEEDPVTGALAPTTLDSSFIVKSVVELGQLKVLAADNPQEDSSSTKKRHPFLVAFVDRFANDPKKAIGALIQKGGLSNDAPTIANLIFRNPDLNRNQVGAYLSIPENRHILRSYIERFRFSGVGIDDALRMFLMSVRMPHSLRSAEHVLGVVSLQWTETNGQTGFDPSLTLSLVLAIMRLNDALHGATQPQDGLWGPPNPSLSVDDFIAGFREHDPRFLVPEDLLTRIYASVRKERIEQASDNSIFSMTPDIEASIEPAKLPMCLTYRAQSIPITITIPEPDAKFSIKLHGTDLKFDPPLLTFAKSNTQTFRVTGTALGVRAMVLIKVGANAPRYQGLPLTKAFSIERAFMQHTFQVSFTNHLDVKRKYMFSTLNAPVRSDWLRAVREQTTRVLSEPTSTDPKVVAAEAVAVQVLRDVLIPPEEPPLASTAAPSPRPNTAAPRFTSNRPGSRMNTPTQPGAGALVRSNSFSKTYAVNFKVEADLQPDKKLGGGSGTQTRRGSRDEAAAAAAATAQARLNGPFIKTGKEIAETTEQNSLLPLVLAFLGLGVSAAPLPVSGLGSAFMLPALPSTTGELFPNVSFVEHPVAGKSAV